MAYHYRKLLSIYTLASKKVRNLQNENIGKIKELMIDPENGRVAYAVLSFGGLLGLGAKLFAIPWEKLSVSDDEKSFILDIEKAILEKASGFDKNHWPDTTDPQWLEDINRFYGGHYFDGRDSNKIPFQVEL